MVRLISAVAVGAGGKPGAFNPGAKSQVHEDDIYATGLGGGDSRFRGGDLTDHFDVVGAFLVLPVVPDARSHGRRQAKRES